MWREKKQILRAYKCVFLYVNILPLGVSIRGGNLKSAFREYERMKSFLHGLGSVSKRGEIFFCSNHYNLFLPRCCVRFMGVAR
jgi:hypothetical protein